MTVAAGAASPPSTARRRSGSRRLSSPTSRARRNSGRGTVCAHGARHGRVARRPLAADRCRPGRHGGRDHVRRRARPTPARAGQGQACRLIVATLTGRRGRRPTARPRRRSCGATSPAPSCGRSRSSPPRVVTRVGRPGRGRARPVQAASVPARFRLTDVASSVGLDFRHGVPLRRVRRPGRDDGRRPVLARLRRRRQGPLRRRFVRPERRARVPPHSGLPSSRLPEREGRRDRHRGDPHGLTMRRAGASPPTSTATERPTWS